MPKNETKLAALEICDQLIKLKEKYPEVIVAYDRLQKRLDAITKTLKAELLEGGLPEGNSWGIGRAGKVWIEANVSTRKVRTADATLLEALLPAGLVGEIIVPTVSFARLDQAIQRGEVSERSIGSAITVEEQPTVSVKVKI